MRYALVPAVLLLALAARGADGGRAAPAACAHPLAPAAYAASVRRALRSGEDVWGNELIRRGGATYEGVSSRLAPLLYAVGPRGRSLTTSGVHYVPFGWPSRFGVTNVALHVADGSEILAQRTRGAKLQVGIGASGREPYGRCGMRLPTPALADGYLPILQTRYSDAAGIPYEQESFATRIRHTRSLVSFVRVRVDATQSEHAVAVRFVVAGRKGARTADDGASLVRGGKTILYASAGGVYDGQAMTYIVPPGTADTVYAGWLIDPSPSRPLRLDDASYARFRQALVTFWSKQLERAAVFDVPDERVRDAVRNLLVQNMTLGWRYSVGDKYHTKLSTPEAIDAAEVMGEYGYPDFARAILDVSFWRKLAWTANWRMGEQLAGTARYYALFGDRAYVDARTPRLARYTMRLRSQIVAKRTSLLNRERYSADIDRRVFGLHSQSVAWKGLRAMGSVWSETGDHALAARARSTAKRLRTGLARATRKSMKRLKDGSLFVPVRLGDGERPYGALTASRFGSYWNLVMPYALASGFFPPHSREARGLYRYIHGHGSRLLGLTRAAAFTIYGEKRFPQSGTDQVYGLNLARFLADNDRPDQLALSLYGQLGAGMTQGTFVSGEAATVAPFRGEYYRTMFLPPNSASNSVFLGLVRLILVHEKEGKLELAYATPRQWLAPGKRIDVARAPTSFGELSYSLVADEGVVHARLDVPRSGALKSVKLRLRLPIGRRLVAVVVDGRAHLFAADGTIDLGRRAGAFAVDATYR